MTWKGSVVFCVVFLTVGMTLGQSTSQDADASLNGVGNVYDDYDDADGEVQDLVPI
jgi:hypothetical protein